MGFSIIKQPFWGTSMAMETTTTPEGAQRATAVPPAPATRLGALQPGLLLGSVEEIVVLRGALLALVEILGRGDGPLEMNVLNFHKSSKEMRKSQSRLWDILNISNVCGRPMSRNIPQTWFFRSHVVYMQNNPT